MRSKELVIWPNESLSAVHRLDGQDLRWLTQTLSAHVDTILQTLEFSCLRLWAECYPSHHAGSSTLLTTHRYLTPFEGLEGILPNFQQLLQEGGSLYACIISYQTCVDASNSHSISKKPTPTLLFRQLNSALYVFQEQTHYSRMHCWTQCRNTWVNFYGVCIQVLRLKDQMVFLAIKFLNAPYLTYRMFALLSSLV